MPSGRGEPLPFYQARRETGGTWKFRTPTSESGGYLNRFDCLKAAANTERQDLAEAKDLTMRGPISQVLRAHFFPNACPSRLPSPSTCDAVWTAEAEQSEASR